MTAGPRLVRIFISSPGDVEDERSKAREVIAQLQRAYGPDRVLLEPVLWKDLPIQLDGPFQQGIETVLAASGGIDIAVFILWSRLGSPTGQRRPDGTEYRSGTEREFELMLAAREASGGSRPALLAYVRRDDMAFKQLLDTEPPSSWESRLSQYRLAEQFVVEHFHDDQGRNLRAYHSFDQPVSFAKRLKLHLQAVLDELLGDEVPRTRWTGPPYRGLDVFEVDDAPIFFGREKETCELEERFRQRQKAEGLAFVCVVGASGAGKSSLVRAGLAASLLTATFDETVRGWRNVFVLPRLTAGAPATGVANAVWRAAVPEIAAGGLDEQSFVAEFRRNPEAALRLSLTPALAKAQLRLLVGVDQLEELFTDPHLLDDERRLLWRGLEALARSGVVWVVTTLRADFYARAQLDDGFIKLKGVDGQFDLTPSGAEGLSSIISQPAAMAGLRFERDVATSLQTRILAEALAQPNALPLVEHLLAELWKQRSSEGVLTIAAYEALGGVAGAIGRHAEKVFARLPDSVRGALPGVLRRIVAVHEDGTVTSRSVALSLFEDPPARALLEAFTAERLLLTERDTDVPLIRVTHEALFASWPLAKQLIEAEAERLVARGRLEDSWNRWKSGGKPDDLLLTAGLPLVEAESLVTAWGGELPESLRDYVLRSRRRATRRRSTLLAIGAMALVALTVSAISASRNANLARTAEAMAQQRVLELLVTQSRFLANESGRQQSARIATLVALEGLPRADERPLVQESLWALSRAEERLPSMVMRHGGPITTAAVDEEGRLALTASSDGVATLWSLETGQPLQSFTQPAGPTTLRFSSSGRLAFVGADDGKTMVWLVADGGLIDGPAHQAAVASGRFSTDDTLLLTASRDGLARVWRVGSPYSHAVDLPHDAGVNGAVFSKDEARVLTASDDGTARLFERSGAELQRLEHRGPVVDAVFSQNPTLLFTASEDRQARLWNSTDGGWSPRPLKHDDIVWSMAESPDGRTLATGCRSGDVTLWDLRRAKPLPPIRGKQSVIQVTFNHRGDRLLTRRSDGSAQILDANTGRTVTTFTQEAALKFASFVGASDAVFTASADGTAQVWRRHQVTSAWTRPLNELPLLARFGNDGVLVVMKTGEISLYDARSGEPLGVNSVGTTDLVNAQADTRAENVIAQSVDGALWHRRGRHLEPLSVELHSGAGPVAQSALSSDGASTLFVSENRQPVVVRDGVSTVLPELAGEIGAIAIGSKGALAVLTDSRGKPRLWRASSPNSYEQLNAGESAVTFTRFSEDAKTLLLASRKSFLVLQLNQSVRQVLSSNEGATTAAFSADGRFLAISAERIISLWDISTQSRMGSLVHEGTVRGLEFSPDNQRLLSFSNDGTAVLWDLSTGRRNSTFSHSDEVVDASFDSSGSKIVTVAMDRSVSVWSAPPSVPSRLFVDETRRRLANFGWSLDDEERRRFVMEPPPSVDSKSEGP